MFASPMTCLVTVRARFLVEKQSISTPLPLDGALGALLAAEYVVTAARERSKSGTRSNPPTPEPPPDTHRPAHLLLSIGLHYRAVFKRIPAPTVTRANLSLGVVLR